MNDIAQAQIAAAEQTLHERAQAARAATPEYTLVAVTTALGTEIGIYVRGQGAELDWTFLRVHRGTDVQALADVLREQGAPVHVHTNVYNLNMGGPWQEATDRFRQSPESERLAAEVNAMFRHADTLEDEWANNDRWGDSGASRIRTEAQYKIDRLKNLSPAYPVQNLRPRRSNRVVPKGWYLP